MTVLEVAVGRATTIRFWLGTRVAAEMLFAGENELLFIRGTVEYMGPFVTFTSRRCAV